MADALAKLGTKSLLAVDIPRGASKRRIVRHLFRFLLSRQFLAFCLSETTHVHELARGHLHSGDVCEKVAVKKSIAYAPPVAKSDDFSVTPLLGLDCEMVGVGPTGEESELARVCVINQDGNVLLDEFAMPERRITDYRTRYSGIRPCDLKGAAPVAEVQRKVADLVFGHTLVGHALENDLAVLGLRSHPVEMLRDTACIPRFCYGGRKGRPRKLRDLASNYLRLDIQAGEHSPVDDARAAMYLYKAYEQGLK